jgi:nucleoside-diphosphate-sugar epimerase
VLVTGADGFVGAALCRQLAAAGYPVHRAVRAIREDGSSQPAFAIGDIGAETDWSAALSGASCVVHLAARTHVLRDAAADAIAEYRRTNVAATHRLAQQAASAGVRRLVFLSSIKVNGEATFARPYTESDVPAPEDAYGVTKHEAENALREVASATGLDAVVLRPPLVYGPGVRGNFRRLLGMVARGTPLPLASVHNRRSLIFVGNLVDAILAVATAPQAAGRTYLVSDGEDVSTPGLIREMARALGRPARLLPCPGPVLHAAAAVLGRREEAARLTGSLQIDAALIRAELAWLPRYSLAQGLVETARWYHASSGA